MASGPRGPTSYLALNTLYLYVIPVMTFAGPRVYFAMARDRLFFGGAARVHPRYRTPAVARFAIMLEELPIAKSSY